MAHLLVVLLSIYRRAESLAAPDGRKTMLKRTIFAALALAALNLNADSFDLTTPAGTIHVVSVLAHEDNGRAHIAAVATNVSKRMITSSVICFHVEGDARACSIKWTQRGIWAAGRNIEINDITRAKLASSKYTVSLTGIEQAK